MNPKFLDSQIMFVFAQIYVGPFEVFGFTKISPLQLRLGFTV
jgi:hypothetical protein